MFWFYMHCLLPALQALYFLLDLVLGWSTLLSPLGALIISGAVTGLAVNLCQKYLGNQKWQGLCKADLKRLKELRLASQAAGDKEKVARLVSVANKISTRYAWGAMKPALLSVLPLCVLAMWTASRLSFEPVRPGDEIEVVAYFEDGATGFAHLVPNQGLNPVGPAIMPVAVPRGSAALPGGDSGREAGAANAGPQARWKVKAAGEGDFKLAVRYNDATCGEVLVPVRSKGGRAADALVVFNAETPTHDNLQAVELKLKDSVPAAWWNLKEKWIGLYLAVALLFGFGLRPIMRIQ